MIKLMRRFTKQSRHGEKGFTLIELLVAIAILGILIAVVVPNVTNFLSSGKLAAANNEASMVQSALLGYQADNGGAIPTADDYTATGLGPYMQGTLVGTYVWDATTGMLTNACTYPGLPTGCTFDGVRWTKAP